MHWADAVLLAAALLVGLPSARRNPTAAAMVVAYLIVSGIYWRTGIRLGYDKLFLIDVAVITVIYAKTATRCGVKTYDSWRHQLRCMAADLTPWDRVIVALFVFGAWPVYISTLSEYQQWYLLWAIAIGQFLIAGAEVVQAKRTARHVEAPDLPHTPSLRLASVYSVAEPCLPPAPALRSMRGRSGEGG